jgi:UDP-2-acetamido-2-deoxy-ribo-hexuluronate aminotransferase
MKLVDLKPSPAVQAEILVGIKNVMQHGRYVMGPEIDQLEKQLAEFVGVSDSICVSNGTIALLIALMALDVGAGDEVIVPDFTFFAPAEMALLLGAKVVPVDIDSGTYNLDPNLLESAITDKTKAIIAVSLYGQCADFSKINVIADKHNIPVIEDAAQSFGATHHGVKSCALTTIACTSFFPTKPLGGFGDGGALFTNNNELSVKIKAIRQHGEVSRYSHELLGLNGRMSSFQASVLLVKLSHFKEDIINRQRIAALYDAALKDVVQTPVVLDANSTVCAQYTIEVDDRAQVMDQLQQLGIPSAVHYPMPVHKQPIFKDICGVGFSCPVSAAASDRVLSLPFALDFTTEDVATVADALHQVV